VIVRKKGKECDAWEDAGRREEAGRGKLLNIEGFKMGARLGLEDPG